MKKIAYIALAAAALAGATACDNRSDVSSPPFETNVSQSEDTLTVEPFSGEQAVSAVLRDRPEFPLPNEAKPISTMTGGPAPGMKVEGTMTTVVEQTEQPDTYIVTLREDWNFKFNDKAVKGEWIYEVTPASTRLMASEDNTDLIHLVK